MLTIAGTGNRKEDVTLGTLNALQEADVIILKTQISRVWELLREMNLKFISLDYIFEKSRNFDTLNENLAREVIRISKKPEIANAVYLVDGSVGGDMSAKILMKKVKNARIIGGVHKESAAALTGACVRLDISAYELDEKREISLPILVYDVDSQERASEIKLILMDKFGEETECIFSDGDVQTTLALFELDRQKNYGIYTTVYIGESELTQKQRYTFNDLVTIIKMLRAENGCAWDRAQTHESIRQNLIEECYELVEAIDKQDDQNMCEETGDVLLQAIFHSIIAQERGAFNVDDALTQLCQKLIFRHTHIFSRDKADDAKEALAIWEKNKNVEKNYKNASETLQAVPKALPQLIRAEKVKKRSAKVNFDFSNLNETLEKINEESMELRDAVKNNDAQNTKEECGDLLLAAACAVVQAGYQPELCLKESIDKYIERFIVMEKLIVGDGRESATLTAEEYDRYWKKAKASKNR